MAKDGAKLLVHPLRHCRHALITVCQPRTVSHRNTHVKHKAEICIARAHTPHTHTHTTLRTRGRLARSSSRSHASDTCTVHGTRVLHLHADSAPFANRTCAPTTVTQAACPGVAIGDFLAPVLVSVVVVKRNMYASQVRFKDRSRTPRAVRTHQPSRQMRKAVGLAFLRQSPSNLDVLQVNRVCSGRCVQHLPSLRVGCKTR